MQLRATYPINMFFAGTLLLGPCDETLPLYSEPEIFLASEMRTQYVCMFPMGNRMTAYLDVTNVYDETLDDTVQFQGTIEFRSVRKPHIKRTFVIGSAQLASAPGYNPQTRRLTLDPGKTLVFLVSWDLSLDDRGVDPRPELFRFYKDKSCPDLRNIAVREEFIISGEVTIFDQRAPVMDSMVFPLCYYSAAVEPPFFDCVSVLTDPPCIIKADTAQERTYPFGYWGGE